MASFSSMWAGMGSLYLAYILIESTAFWQRAQPEMAVPLGKRWAEKQNGRGDLRRAARFVFL
jgi:hypothetical protein